MHSTTNLRRALGATVAVVVAGLGLAAAAAPAAADPVATARASAYGATIEVAGQALVPPTPSAAVDAPPPGEAVDTVVDIPADPVAVSATLTAAAAVHQQSDLASGLTVETQAVPGPYNARAATLVEGLDVLLDVPTGGVSLVSADAVRSEAVAVCTGGTVQYSANSEIVDLRVGGEALPLNAPVQDLIDAISDLLSQTGLNQVVDVQRNVVTPTADGIAVDALVVTVLAVAGDPVARVVIGHAEVGAAQCGTMPQCNDAEDNDGDGAVDFPADPDCESLEDTSEFPECSDTVDNDGDGRIDFPADPGCSSPSDDDESDDPAVPAPTGQTRDDTLARTGGSGTAALAVALGGLGVLGLALRRRILA